MSFLWSLIVGGIIGWIASLITGRDIPGGIIGNIIAGFIGAWLGSLIFGDLGPEIGGFEILPAIIGSILLVLIVSFVLRKMGHNRKQGHS
ncbi:GlsB/YeaQ/YmgE family stress response membrane protein [Bacillus suaedaesalsae]|uniref:GlsB/YeaQ/YmgE family stress response membrane protein n=1 Tax=Bacillus suaedaesalsae TaxID=2810349 RepID=A0ABS2DH72_9BACI|nr:GlsB/YeaQ/YmgE family stress response membrane protein [Bacillus suaedaesalsae]MBM6617815.1 GlsB/YeaQ/YmgE family stress response membrane protein [Bacillus suaedaesalsae]